MVILLKDFTWSQSPTVFYIDIDFPQVNKKDIEVLLTSDYLKISQSPFLFEAFLPHEIVPSESSLVCCENSLKVKLVKVKANVCWMTATEVLTKEDSVSWREKAYIDYQNSCLASDENHKVLRHHNEQMVIRKHIEKDEHQRHRINEAREESRQKTLASLFHNEKSRENETTQSVKEGKLNQLFKPIAAEDTIRLPEIRNLGLDNVHVPVQFTPRSFPTAARESLIEKETQVEKSCIPVPEKEVPEEKVSRDEVLEEKVSRDEVLEEKVSGKEVPEEKVSRDEVLEEKVSGKEVPEEKVSKDEASEQEVSEKEVTEGEAWKFLSKVAKLCFERENYIEALPIFERASELCPNDPVTETYHACCLLELGKPLEAKNLATKALDEMPADKVAFRVKCLTCRAKAYLELNQDEDALTDIQLALSLQPNDVETEQ